nr:FecR family protein [uncultured Prevotella sp.]
MFDNNIKEIGLEEQQQLAQMVAEALMRDCKQAPDADAEWQKLAARMSGCSETSDESGSSTRRFSKYRILWTVVATAAAVAIVVVMFFAKDFFRTDRSALYQAKAEPMDIVILDEDEHEHVVKGNELALAPAPVQKVENHTVVVPAGKDMKITLADGTQVWLNQNSRLTYPTAFRGKERKVSLKGEAYFKVTHDASHPFIVNAGDMQTRVLGTEFNVNASDASHPHVTLVEGSVSVSSMNHPANKVIVPGEDAALNQQGEIMVSHVDTNDVACWREGIELFDDVTLRDILVQMGSWYNVSVVCHDDAVLNTHLRYMYDRKQSLEEAVKMLNQISNNKIKLHNNTILVE